MTLPRFRELLDYWRDYPPTHILTAARLGIKPKKKASADDLKAEVIAAGGRVVKQKKG